MTWRSDQLFDTIEKIEMAESSFSNVFIEGHELPNGVFSPIIKYYYVIEHGYLITREFAETIENISNYNSDENINYISIKPSPKVYRKSNTGFYGGFSLKVSEIVQNYIPIMTMGGHVESFASRGGDVACIWGNSEQWGVYIDRIGWETMVIGSSCNIEECIVGDIRVMSRHDMILYGNSQRLPENMINEFNRNYIN